MKVKLSDIKITYNCREFSDDDLKSLMASMSRDGLHQPVSVRPLEEGGYGLVMGHRRLRAAQLLGWTEIDAVKSSCTDEHAAKIANIIENIERSNLNILEEAHALRSLYPGTIVMTRAARDLNRPDSWVEHRIKLLDLHPVVQKLFADGKLPVSAIEHLRRIAGDDQVKFAKAAVEGGLRAIPNSWAAKARARGRKEIQAMMGELASRDIGGIALKLLAWVYDSITTEDMLAALDEYVEKRGSLSDTGGE